MAKVVLLIPEKQKDVLKPLNNEEKTVVLAQCNKCSIQIK